MSATNTTSAQKKEKMVKITPELYPGVLEDDINISINGKRWLIPRGQESEVPEYVYKEYLRSKKATRRAAENSKKMHYNDPVQRAESSTAQAVGQLVM